MENQKTAEQIRAEIALNKDAEVEAFANLQAIVPPNGKRDAEYYKRLTTALNLCSYICRERAKLEFELMEALRDGR